MGTARFANAADERQRGGSVSELDSNTATETEDVEPPVGRPDRGWSRRTWTLLWSLVVVATLGLVGGFVQVPYVALGPGPTYDTLSSVDGTQVVAVSGTRTYQTSGQLRMVTVSLTDKITLFSALGLWITGGAARGLLLARRDRTAGPAAERAAVQGLAERRRGVRAALPALPDQCGGTAGGHRQSRGQA